ncbi:ER lumen protein-retaining receptor A-like [Phalaenopsis equestris]|uniref:ER lumen protein-retaining receptor A-like n=1 Tax=Phalaenopsis equestris TaxID=78828 RepID=UPI0009E5CCC7|nr:ER lumen protein-retaining receptor A-like [Phalaenopsis equestris]
MNIFRLAGDMTHLFSVLVLLLKIYATKTCSGISLKTQELYVLVFLTRYLDLLTVFVSVYNSVMKVVFISSSIAIVWCMRAHPLVRRTYDKELDTFRHYILVGGSLVLAFIFHDEFTVREVLKTFLVYGLAFPISLSYYYYY